MHGRSNTLEGAHLIVRVIHIALFVCSFCLTGMGVACAQSSGKQNTTNEKDTPTQPPPYTILTDPVAVDDFEAAHNVLLDAENMQFDRPFEEVQAPREYREPPAFFKWLGSLFSAIGPIFQFLFYIGLAIISAGVLYFIFTQIPNIRLRGLRKKDAATAETDHIISTRRPDEKKARSWLEEADALARDGKYSEAVHLLLFRSIEDIQSRRKQKIPTALTAREIEQIEGLPERPRNALRPIIALVERSFFGGHGVDAESWTSARQAYEHFAFGDAWT